MTATKWCEIGKLTEIQRKNTVEICMFFFLKIFCLVFHGSTIITCCLNSLSTFSRLILRLQLINLEVVILLRFSLDHVEIHVFHMAIYSFWSLVTFLRNHLEHNRNVSQCLFQFLKVLDGILKEHPQV